MKVIYCPVNGCCMMYPDTDPIDECDDFATFWDKGDDYVAELEKKGEKCYA